MYKILILTHCYETPYWVAETIRAIKNTGNALCTIAQIELSGEKGNTSLPYFSKMTRVGRYFLLNNSDKYFENVNLKAEYKFTLAEQLKTQLSQEEFDYILWLGDTKRVDQFKRYCTRPLWYFDNVTTVKNRLDSAFISMHSNESFTPFALYETKGEVTTLIGWAISNNSPYSIQTARQSYASLMGIPARVLSKDIPSAGVSRWYGHKHEDHIDPRINIIFLIILYVRFARVVIKKILTKLRKPRWILGLVEERYESIERFPELKNIRILKPPNRNIGWADSFIIEHEKKVIIFAEEIDKKGKGHIVALTPTKNRILTQNILKEKYHLSYPYIFEYKENWYMVPESSENRTVSLYHATNFPYEWEWEMDIFKETSFVDSTIFKFKNKWWLFANGKKYANSFNEEMYIFYADSPLGEWKPHQLNPVKNDIRVTRCAGRPQIFNNILYRPAQDCSLRYGHRIIWNKINELSPTEFEEEIVGAIDPEWINGLDATHTINIQGNYFILDGYTK